jgi:SAM-dependent methyltransferase
MEVLIYVIAIGIFAFLCFMSIYLIVLFVSSKGFKISPTVTSDAKSIKEIAKYIKNYNETILKKVNLKILDIGSGYGKLLFKVNKILNNPENIFIGYEISNFAYKISKFKNKFKNIFIFKDDIHNIKDLDFDFIVSFMLAKQQPDFISIYKKFPVGAIILANSNAIPFKNTDGYELIDKIKVHFGWEIYVYKKIV